MGKKKHHVEEHVNLERYLISYADFITLLFATFVVLYALAQSDISTFKEVQDSLRKAFSAPSILQGSDGLMPDSSASNGSIFDATGESAVPPLLEYLSPKYEEASFNQIKDSLDRLEKSGMIEGLDIKVDERGLNINIVDTSLFFNSGTAVLKKESSKTLGAIATAIKTKFATHSIRVEGFTDNLPINSVQYPSNWELSSARASSVVRFLTEKFSLKKELFSAVGYADTKPIMSNATEAGRIKNRRVGIVVLRNALVKSEAKTLIKDDNKPKDPIKKQHEQNSDTSHNDISDAAKKLAKESGQPVQKVIVLRDAYEEETIRLAKELKEHESRKKKELNVKIKEIQNNPQANIRMSEAVKNLLKEKKQDAENKKTEPIKH